MEIIINFLKELWGIVGEMSPYLLFGFLVAGILSVLISPATVEKHVGRGGALSVFKASLFGVPLPLCSCGVIPVGMSLRRHGAGRAATTAFLISTPQTGVDSMMVTYSLLGPLFAVVRPVAALITGFAGGLIVNAVDKDDAPAAVETSCAASGNCSGGACGPSADSAQSPSGNKYAAAARYGFITLPNDIGRFLFFGLILAAVISAIVPENYFSNYLGGGILPMLAMMAVGIPMYVCSTASVPVAMALMMGGVSPGAALVFLMTGPATNAATITTIWKVLGRRTALIYLGTIAAGSLMFGLGIDALWSGEAARHFHNMHHDMLPVWFKNVSAVALLIIIAPSLWNRKFKIAEEQLAPESAEPSGNESLVLQIQGMRCSRCVESITNNVAELAGVQSVDIDLESGRGVITGKSFNEEKLISTIEELGYSVK